MMARLGELQAKMTQFGELAGQLAAAIPKRSEGRDASGYALVVLGSDGLPERFTIRDGWQHRLASADLGAAVMEACGDAVRRGMTEWTDHLDDTRWWQHQKRLDEDGPRAEDTRPPAVPGGTAREPGELSEEVLKALHDVQQPAPTPTQSVDGSDLGRHVTVTLGPAALLNCGINAEWAARRDGEAITPALNQALRAAKEAVPTRPALGAGLDGLLGDALATLRAITRTRPAEGDSGE